jgi:arylsulfatase
MRAQAWGLWARRERAFLALALAVGCGHTPPPGPPGALLVVLDAAGARHLSAYGNARPTSPRVDRLAGEGTLFERAYAQASWTLPSTASLLTGRYPPRRRQDRLVVSGETLATRLHAAGVATAAFSENPLVTKELGFAAGFDEFREYFPKRLHDERPRDYPRVASDATVDDAIAWLGAHRGDPFFVYVHLLPPHCPYPAPPPFGARFDPDYDGDLRGVPDTLLRINDRALDVTPRDLEHLRLEYEENLAFADHQVGRLLDAVEALGLRARTLVVVTADHGEAFGEHGAMLHTTNLHDELLHVPLVVRFPQGTPTTPRRWPGLVELRDVSATIARRFALPAPPGLLETVRGTWRPRAFARAWTADGERTLGAVTTARHKLLVDRRTRRLELYDLLRDPGERVDVAARERAVAVRLVRALRRGEGGTFGRRARPLDPATVDRLRALGYVGPQ